MKKNLYLYMCIGAIFVFTISYFSIANNISYAFNYDEKAAMYDTKIQQISTISKLYAANHIELFENNDVAYITVDDLVKEELIKSDSDGKVKDPVDPIKTLNNIKIRLTKLTDGFDSVVLN